MDAAGGKFIKENGILKNLLATSKADTTHLPPLVPDTHWYDQLFHWIGQLLKKLIAYFKIPPPSPSMVNLVRILIVIAIVALLIGLAFALIQIIFRKANSISRGPTNVDGPVNPNTDLLEELIESALARPDFALAGRLRWKLFLVRTDRPSNVTPLEILGSGPILNHYKLMFHSSKDPSADYDNFDKTLSRLENLSET